MKIAGTTSGLIFHSRLLCGAGAGAGAAEAAARLHIYVTGPPTILILITFISFRKNHVKFIDF